MVPVRDHLVSKGSDEKLWASGRPVGVRRCAWANVIHSNEMILPDENNRDNNRFTTSLSFQWAWQESVKQVGTLQATSRQTAWSFEYSEKQPVDIDCGSGYTHVHSG